MIAAQKEAQEFIDKCEVLLAADTFVRSSKLSGSVKRLLLMDLTRALAEMRKR